MLSVQRRLCTGVNHFARRQYQTVKGKEVRAVEGAQPLCRSMTDPSTLWSGVVETYTRAGEAGAAFKTPTKTEFMRDDDSGVVFLVRVSESLKEKTKKPENASQEKKKFVNPFLPYEEELWVQHLSDTHTLLLNKFNLVDHHLLVVTREFEKQEEPLNVQDIDATMKVMESMPNGGLAFFNCGPQSGASQPHKHIQVVPLPFDDSLPNEAPITPAVVAGLENGGGSQLLPNLPFKMLGAQLRKGSSPEDVCRKVAELTTMASTEISVAQSFNLLFSEGWVLLIPRQNDSEGPCGVNALGFAGTLFVRSQEEIDYVKKVGPMAILAGVGFPNV
ncbi:hypothetical protein BSKO_09292 [Bryopsis sp. KO-2023]|nr:hypothetical protein BSKO_09292 [Bryopsis sp. KO-2023]